MTQLARLHRVGAVDEGMAVPSHMEFSNAGAIRLATEPRRVLNTSNFYFAYKCYALAETDITSKPHGDRL